MLLKFKLAFGLLCFQIFFLNAQSIELTTQQKASLIFLDSFANLSQSVYWPNVKPSLFIKNIKKNINHPELIYSGTNTNFCGYAALSYTCIKTYPLRYAKFMIELYKNSEAYFRNVKFNPSNNVKAAAGLLEFKGALDINQADQLWYLTLADHFKGYLNIFNREYKPGAEDKLWPATNFAKFNRMLRKICNYKTQSVGSDLMRPYFKNIVPFLNDKIENNHQVFLFLNNAILHNRNHNIAKYRIPTHFVVLFSIIAHDELVTINYWDYGFITQREMPISVFEDIVFGVTWCKKQSEE